MNPVRDLFKIGLASAANDSLTFRGICKRADNRVEIGRSLSRQLFCFRDAAGHKNLGVVPTQARYLTD